MKSAIKDIFHGIRGHMETTQMPKEHFKNRGEKRYNAYDELIEELSPELLRLHQ